jgi:hypothetical protein
MLSLLQLLWPSFLVQFIGFFTIVCVGWFFLSRFQRDFRFNYKSVLVTSTGLWLVFVCNSLVGYYQSGLINSAVADARQTQQGAEQQPVTEAQLKQSFLNDVDTLVQNPQQITPELKQKLFTAYSKLFPNGKTDLENTYKAVNSVYQCQRLFWEDAMASYKSKKAIKSDERKECEGVAGSFFNREKLLPPEVVKRNDDLIKTFSERKRLPASDGKEIEFKEAEIRQSLDAQAKAAENLKKIFE